MVCSSNFENLTSKNALLLRFGLEKHLYLYICIMMTLSTFKKANILQHTIFRLTLLRAYFILHRFLLDPYSDIICSEECQTKKLLVCCKMFALFKAIFKFCTAKRLLSTFSCKNLLYTLISFKVVTNLYIQILYNHIMPNLAYKVTKIMTSDFKLFKTSLQ